MSHYCRRARENAPPWRQTSANCSEQPNSEREDERGAGGTVKNPIEWLQLLSKRTKYLITDNSKTQRERGEASESSKQTDARTGLCDRGTAHIIEFVRLGCFDRFGLCYRLRLIKRQAMMDQPSPLLASPADKNPLTRPLRRGDLVRVSET